MYAEVQWFVESVMVICSYEFIRIQYVQLLVQPPYLVTNMWQNDLMYTADIMLDTPQARQTRQQNWKYQESETDLCHLKKQKLRGL
jgi:hypothetical protein